MFCAIVNWGDCIKTTAGIYVNITTNIVNRVRGISFCFYITSRDYLQSYWFIIRADDLFNKNIGAKFYYLVF